MTSAKNGSSPALTRRSLAASLAGGTAAFALVNAVVRDNPGCLYDVLHPSP